MGEEPPNTTSSLGCTNWFDGQQIPYKYFFDSEALRFNWSEELYQKRLDQKMGNAGWEMFTLGFGLSGLSNEKAEYVCVEDLEPIHPSS